MFVFGLITILLYPDFRLAFCFGFTICFIRSLRFNNLKAPRLGRRSRILLVPFGLLWAAGLTWRPAGAGLPAFV
jgi:hypothetical protein